MTNRAARAAETLIWTALVVLLASGLVLADPSADPSADPQARAADALMMELWAQGAHRIAAEALFAALYLRIALGLVAEAPSFDQRLAGSVVGLTLMLGLLMALLSPRPLIIEASYWVEQWLGLNLHALLGAAMLLAMALKRWRPRRRRAFARAPAEPLLAALIGAALLAILFGASLLRGEGPWDDLGRETAAITPMRLLPEWYVRPFYTVLRAVPDKVLGAAAAGAAGLALIIAPWLSFRASRRGSGLAWARRIALLAFFFAAAMLGSLAPQRPEAAAFGAPISVAALSLGVTAYVFIYLLLIRPGLSLCAPRNADDAPMEEVFR
ncbi:MAG: hypothetical protein AAGM38_06395 [Pseudomonadota bacterium]